MTRHDDRKRTEVSFAYERIAREMEARIARHEYAVGSRLPAEQEIADSFEVNRLTARKAMDMLVRKGMIRRQQGRGTFVTGSRTGAPTIVYVAHGIDEHFFKDLNMELAAEVQKRGGRLVSFSLPSHETPGPELIAAMRETQSLVIQSAVYEQHPDFFDRRDISTVVICHEPYVPRRPAYLMPLDRTMTTLPAVDHLVGLGHQRILLVSKCDWPPPGENREPTPGDKVHPVYFGYRHALLVHGLSWHRMVDKQAFESESDRERARKILLGPNRPTAILCEIDSYAKFVYAAASDLGLRILRDLSVVGIGNTPWCQAFHPMLTSVSYQEKQMANVMVRLCAGPAPKEMITCTITPRLIVRESTATPG